MKASILRLRDQLGGGPAVGTAPPEPAVAAVVRGLERKGETYVYVDRGRKQGFADGDRLSVFALGRGGVRTPRGHLRIRKAFDDLSECEVVALLDAAHPIVRGDSVERGE